MEATTRIPTTAARSAEEVILQAAHQIGMMDVNEGAEQVTIIRQNLQKEFVTYQWQLEELDSFQWQCLGAPIGLVASIRRVSKSSSASEEPTMTPTVAAPPKAASRPGGLPRESTGSEISTDHNQRGVLPSFVSSRAAQLFASSTTSSSSASLSSAILGRGDRMISLGDDQIAPPRRTSAGIQPQINNQSSPPISFVRPRQTVVHLATLNEEAKYSDSESPRQLLPTQPEETNGKRKENAAPDDEHCNEASKNRRFLQGFRDMFAQFPIRHLLLQWSTFPLTGRFRKSILHGKSGTEVKSHTIFTIEMNILVSALVLGAAVELWGVFPVERVEQGGNNLTYIPSMLAIMYHVMSCLSVFIQLLCTSGWIWTLYAATAVSPKKFKRFLVQVQTPYGILMYVTELGQNVFVMNVSLLLAALIAISTTSPLMRQLGFYLPMVVVIVGCRFFNFLATYMGRVAYHGMLLRDADVDANEKRNILEKLVADRGCAAKDESTWRDEFTRDLILEEEQVLDVYRCTRSIKSKQRYPKQQGEGVEVSTATKYETNRDATISADIIRYRARGGSPEMHNMGKRGGFVEEV